MIVTGFVIAASVAGALGQGMTGLSANCQAAAASVLTGPAAECLGLPQFMNVVTTPANQSLIMPINNWLTSTCAQPACTNDTLEAAVSNITNGCANDLHITSIEAQEITQSIKEWYSVGREVACLQDTSNGNVYCATTTLQKLETWFGAPLTLANLPALSYKLDANNGPPKEVVCTDCARTAYTIIRPHLTISQQNSVDEYLNGLCGSGFTSGSAPAAIKQTANNGGSGSSGAVSLSLGMSSTGALLAIVGGLALLVAST